MIIKIMERTQVAKLKNVEKSLKLKDTREYNLECVLSLTSLPLCHFHYWSSSKDIKSSNSQPRMVHNGAFVQEIVPLEDEDEDGAILA